MVLSPLLAPTTAAAQPAQSISPAQRIEAPRQTQASLGQSMAKAVTMKIATFTIGTGVYAFGTGSLAEGTALSAINAAGSFVVFTANDFGWDYFWPNTNVSANGSFHTLTSLSRNTAKYLTLKPMLTAMNLATVYWWTGSAATTAVTGGAIVLGMPLVFYVNNTLWDWYDWRTVSNHP
jgi:hypothetical protein